MISLNGKKVLVTAGSTWVAIDKVRVITNIFGGALGLCIADYFSKQGAIVTLLLGSGRQDNPIISKNVEVIKFKYFNDLLDLVKGSLEKNKFDVVIHSAAVSDYEPVSVYDGKIKSGNSNMVLELKPTIKIVDIIKKISPSVFLVKFKLEVGVTKEDLISIATKSMHHSRADLIVANEFGEVGGQHKAYIIDKSGNVQVCEGKTEIAKNLFDVIEKSS